VNTPRYPTFRDVVVSKRKEIAFISTADLGLTPGACGWEGARTKVLSVAAAPPRRSTGTIVQDDGRAAEWLFEFIAQRGLV
jgi:electron transfer flavoprotein beta subunit